MNSEKVVKINRIWIACLTLEFDKLFHKMIILVLAHKTCCKFNCKLNPNLKAHQVECLDDQVIKFNPLISVGKSVLYHFCLVFGHIICNNFDSFDKWGWHISFPLSVQKIHMPWYLDTPSLIGTIRCLSKLFGEHHSDTTLQCLSFLK